MFSDVSGKEIKFTEEKMMGTLKILTLVQPSYFQNKPQPTDQPMMEEVNIDLNAEEITKVKELLDTLHNAKSEVKEEKVSRNKIIKK